jgi:tRNA nucleotidyltransferase (CCA-adding enzyme)
MEETGLLPYVIKRKFGGNLNEIIPHMEICPPLEPMRLALFLSWTGNSCASVMKGLCFDNKTLRETVNYVSYLFQPIIDNRYEIKRFLKQMPQESFEKLLDLKMIINSQEPGELEAIRREALDIYLTGECFSLKSLAVNGNDLLKAGFTGKAVGDALNALLDAVMKEPSLNRKDRLLRRLHQIGDTL